MTLTNDTRLGPYEVTAAIGSGGMGEVYRARDARLGRDVAIKVLPPAFSADSDRLRRFEQEARAAAGLNHPNITKDGKRFLINVSTQQQSQPNPLTVVVNWTAGLTK